MRNISLEFEMENNEINCWKGATSTWGTNSKAGINSFDFSFEELVSLIQILSFVCKYHN